MDDIARNEAGRTLACEGCGTYKTADSYRRNGYVSCCPERKMVELSFQGRVGPWMAECFGPLISSDIQERGDRFLEEALELLQAHGYDFSRVPTLVGYVAGRPKGEPSQEVGGVMVTLAAYCLATGIDMHEAGETELARIWTKVPQIRAKQATKADIHGPLP